MKATRDLVDLARDIFIEEYGESKNILGTALGHPWDDDTSYKLVVLVLEPDETLPNKIEHVDVVYYPLDFPGLTDLKDPDDDGF